MSGTEAEYLAKLTRALAPKNGMRRISFAVDSYRHPSLPLSAKRILNLYAEQEPTDARTEVALLSTPGLRLFTTYGSGPILAMNDDAPGRLYVASGTALYRVRPDQEMPPENLGNIGTTTDDKMITIAVGPVGMVVCVPPRAYTCSHSEPMNEIGGTFPGASSVTYLDGYFVFTSTENSSRFFSSKLLDPNAFDALDFAYADGLPNVLRRVVAHQGDLWLLGEAGVEIWSDVGLAAFPFQRAPGGVIPHGCVSPRSVTMLDGSVFWLGTDCTVWRGEGYRASRVSTHAIEAMIRAFNPASVLAALAYTDNGHPFYALTFASGTMVYDCRTQRWAERSSSEDGTGRWRPQAVSLRGATVLFGDSVTGAIYHQDAGLDTDADVLVPRQATLPTIWGGTNRAFLHRLEIEMETGVSGDVTLEWSDDGGFTWPGRRVLASGAASEHRNRVVTNRLGSFRQRTFRVTMYKRGTLYGVDAYMELGDGG